MLLSVYLNLCSVLQDATSALVGSRDFFLLVACLYWFRCFGVSRSCLVLWNIIGCYEQFKRGLCPPATLIADGVRWKETFSPPIAAKKKKKSWYERLLGMRFTCVISLSPSLYYFQSSAFLPTSRNSGTPPGKAFSHLCGRVSWCTRGRKSLHTSCLDQCCNFILQAGRWILLIYSWA